MILCNTHEIKMSIFSQLTLLAHHRKCPKVCHLAKVFESLKIHVGMRRRLFRYALPGFGVFFIILQRIFVDIVLLSERNTCSTFIIPGQTLL